MWGGVGRSGSPTPRSIISTPFLCCSAFISSIRAKRYGGRFSIRDAYIGALVLALYSIEFTSRVYDRYFSTPGITPATIHNNTCAMLAGRIRLIIQEPEIHRHGRAWKQGGRTGDLRDTLYSPRNEVAGDCPCAP